MCHSLGIRRECCRAEELRMIDLYYTPGSPPCRLVMLVAAALEVPLNRKVVNLKDEEQLTPEFLALNPQHTVPTIVDGDFVLWESRAIARYLVNRYSKDSKLYPLDHKERALVDQRLDFDLGTLCPAFAQYFYPQLFSGSAPNETQKTKLDNALKHLNAFLEGREFAAGKEMTIADLCLVTTVSTIDAAGINLGEYPNIMRWFDLVKNSTPGYEQYNEKGLLEFKKLIDDVKKMRDGTQSGQGKSGSKGGAKPGGGVQNIYQEQCIQPSGHLYNTKTIPVDPLSNKVTVEIKTQDLTPMLNQDIDKDLPTDNNEKLKNVKNEKDFKDQTKTHSNDSSIIIENPLENQHLKTAPHIFLPQSRALSEAEAHLILGSDTDIKHNLFRRNHKN